MCPKTKHPFIKVPFFLTNIFLARPQWYATLKRSCMTMCIYALPLTYKTMCVHIILPVSLSYYTLFSDRGQNWHTNIFVSLRLRLIYACMLVLTMWCAMIVSDDPSEIRKPVFNFLEKARRYTRNKEILITQLCNGIH